MFQQELVAIAGKATQALELTKFSKEELEWRENLQVDMRVDALKHDE